MKRGSADIQRIIYIVFLLIVVILILLVLSGSFKSLANDLDDKLGLNLISPSVEVEAYDIEEFEKLAQDLNSCSQFSNCFCDIGLADFKKDVIIAYHEGSGELVLYDGKNQIKSIAINIEIDQMNDILDSDFISRATTKPIGFKFGKNPPELVSFDGGWETSSRKLYKDFPPFFVFEENNKKVILIQNDQVYAPLLEKQVLCQFKN